MHLAIVGASGAIGHHLVEQALSAGHTLVAIGRESSKLDHVDAAAIRRGATDDVAFLTEAFAGTDVVLSAIGLMLSGFSPFAACEDPTLLSRSGPAIAAAAEAAGVKRILAVSAGGIGDSAAMMPFLLRALVPLTSLRKLYPELERYEAALFSGSVEACCVRPTTLTDEPATGNPTVVTKMAGQATIPRADVASFMLAHLDGDLPGHGPVLTAGEETAEEAAEEGGDDDDDDDDDGDGDGDGDDDDDDDEATEAAPESKADAKARKKAEKAAKKAAKKAGGPTQDRLDGRTLVRPAPRCTRKTLRRGGV
jgi:putative NADH-flavin reductase